MRSRQTAHLPDNGDGRQDLHPTRKGNFMKPVRTKRTTTAKHTRTKAAKGRSARPREQHGERALGPAHEKIIDAVSDMLTHGGHEDDVDTLLVAAMSHIERRGLGELFSDDPARRNQIIARRISLVLAGWKTDLAAAWLANKRPDRAEFQAKTISERIRAREREVLIDRFEDFLGTATPEELRLLSAIFAARNNGIVAPIEGVEEIPLGDAFAGELDRNETYIRIPRDFGDKIAKYIQALQAKADKPARRTNASPANERETAAFFFT
jgi:hypothetical protein